MTTNPIVPATMPRVAQALSIDDYEAIKEALAARRSTLRYGCRLLAMIQRATGLRESEVMGSGPSDWRGRVNCFHMDGTQHFIRTYRSKKVTQGWEDVPLGADLGAQVMAYLQQFSHLPTNARAFPFTARSYQRAFRDAAESALGRIAHPHQLRHLRLTELIDGGVPLASAAAQLRISMKVAHEVYYDHSQALAVELANRTRA